MKIAMVLFCCSLAFRLEGQPETLNGAWELIGISAQNKEIPELKGLSGLYWYADGTCIVKTGQLGHYRFEQRQWEWNENEIRIKGAGQEFLWRLQIIDNYSWVVEDLRDTVLLTFSKKEGQKPDKEEKSCIGKWFLVEAKGRLLAPSEMPMLYLKNDGHAEAKGWPEWSEEGTWQWTKDQRFLCLRAKDKNQVLELLYIGPNELVLKDEEDLLLFRKNQNPSTDATKQLDKKLQGLWLAENPPPPARTAQLIFYKNGVMNSISDLNSEVKRWELIDEGHSLQFQPFVEGTKEQVDIVRLHLLDKNTIILSDKELSILFRRQNN